MLSPIIGKIAKYNDFFLRKIKFGSKITLHTQAGFLLPLQIQIDNSGQPLKRKIQA
jgi:hypothetical protein